MYFGRFVVIARVGAFLASNQHHALNISPLEMKKDQLEAFPNRSYHHIQQANYDFSPRIVAIARYFRLFLSISIKIITHALNQNMSG